MTSINPTYPERDTKLEGNVSTYVPEKEEKKTKHVKERGGQKVFVVSVFSVPQTGDRNNINDVNEKNKKKTVMASDVSVERTWLSRG